MTLHVITVHVCGTTADAKPLITTDFDVHFRKYFISNIKDFGFDFSANLKRIFIISTQKLVFLNNCVIESLQQDIPNSEQIEL